MKAMKQRASQHLWNIVVKRETPLPVEAISSEKKEYSVKEYVSSTERKEAKVKGGIPIMGLDPPEKRSRAQLLRSQRQNDNNLYKEVSREFGGGMSGRVTEVADIA